MSINQPKLNLVDILNARLRHTQQSVASTNISNMPRVHTGHMNDGIHDLTFGYANTNRVFHELVSSAAKAITDVDRTSTLGNLSDYITSAQTVSTDKLVTSQNGTITDSRFLRLTEMTPGIVSNIDTLIAVYSVDENNAILVTKTQILSYNINSHDLTVLVTVDQSIFADVIVSTKVVDIDKFQILTHTKITQYKIASQLISSDVVLSVVPVFTYDIADIYNNDKLNIIDIIRRTTIDTILSSNSETTWFDEFIAFTDTPLATTGTHETVTMQCLGVLTGKFGIFELIKNSLGDYFLRVLDDETVVKAITYTKQNIRWLIVFNTVGVKTYKIDMSGVCTFNTNTVDIEDELDGATWVWLPENGNIEMVEGSGQYANINGILEYGTNSELSGVNAYSQRIPGASIGDIQYARYTDITGNPAVVLKDTFDNTYRCKFNASSTGMIRLVHDYDLHEFNGFKEVSVQTVVKFNSTDTHFLFSVENVGLILGEITSTADGIAGMRLRNIQKFSDVDNNSVEILPTDNCVFAFNNTTSKLHACAIESDTVVELTIASDITPISMSLPVNDYVFIVDKNKNTVYRAKLKRYYSSVVTDLSTAISDLISNSTVGILANLFKTHTASMHADGSAMTRLNTLIYDLRSASTTDSTVYVSDSDIAYISTGYSLKNIERVVTDKDSTHIYGRVKSKTANACIGISTEAKRSSDSLLFYDTVIAEDGTETSLNSLAYTACRIADNIVRIDIAVPTTYTYYVNNILGWSKGANTGTALARLNLNGGYLSGRLENAITEYQLVLNREYFNIKRIINANCQLASAPLGVYSDKTAFDASHFGMFDSPIITPLCTTRLLTDNTYEITDNQNNEVVLTYCIFGGDALTISVLLETA